MQSFIDNPLQDLLKILCDFLFLLRSSIHPYYPPVSRLSGFGALSILYSHSYLFTNC